MWFMQDCPTIAFDILHDFAFSISNSSSFFIHVIQHDLTFYSIF